MGVAHTMKHVNEQVLSYSHKEKHKKLFYLSSANFGSFMGLIFIKCGIKAAICLHNSPGPDYTSAAVPRYA